MASEIFKVFAPFFIFSLYGFIAYKNRRLGISASLFYVTCFVAMSSNFSLFYRGLFQAVQVFLFFYLVWIVCHRRYVHSVNKILLPSLALIAVSVFFSVLDEDSISQSINFLSIFFVLNLLLIQLDTQKRLQFFIEYIGKLSLLCSVFGVLEYYFVNSTRIEVTFSNPNYLSFFLGIGFCVLASGKRSSLYWLRLSVVLFSIIATGSRAGLIFPLLMLLWATYRSSGVQKTLVRGGVALAVIAALLLSGVTRFSDSQATSGSDAERLLFLKIAVEMANDRPLTGVGWGRFPAEFSEYSGLAGLVYTPHGHEIDVSDHDRRVTHNDLARILAELGYVALILFLLVSVRLFFDAVKISKDKYIFVLPVWMGVYVFSLTHNNLNNLLFWFFFLLPMIMVKFYNANVCKAGKGYQGPDDIAS